MTADIGRLADDALHRLRVNFEASGYKFIGGPSKHDLPGFLQRWSPDGIAVGPTETVVIEVTQRRTRPSNSSLDLLQRDIAAHPGWRLVVIYVGEVATDDAPLRRAEKPKINAAADEVHGLLQFGGNRYALVAAWSLVEAVSRNLYDHRAASSNAQTPHELVERLAMDGYVDVDEAKRMRDLIVARNQSVHGDLDVSVRDADIDFMLTKVRELNEMAID